MPARWFHPALVVLVAAVAQAEIPEVGAQRSESPAPSTTSEQIEGLVRQRDVDRLGELADGDPDTTVRGWAIVGLAKVGGARSEAILTQLHSPRHPPLIRTWAASARVGRAPDLGALRELAALQGQLPALERPLRLAIERHAGSASLEDLLALSKDPALGRAVAPLVLSRARGDELVRLMVQHEDDVVRRQAAAFAASTAARDGADSTVPDEVLRALALPRNTRVQVPWQGGALYVPGLQWGQTDGRRLVKTLMGWWLVLESSGRQPETQQVWNNLYSYQLLTGAGYDMGLQADAQHLVVALARVEGRGSARELMKRIGLSNDPRFREVLR